VRRFHVPKAGNDLDSTSCFSTPTVTCC
jgi:hypothetical protein